MLQEKKREKKEIRKKKSKQKKKKHKTAQNGGLSVQLLPHYVRERETQMPPTCY